LYLINAWRVDGMYLYIPNMPYCSYA